MSQEATITQTLDVLIDKLDLLELEHTIRQKRGADLRVVRVPPLDPEESDARPRHIVVPTDIASRPVALPGTGARGSWLPLIHPADVDSLVEQAFSSELAEGIAPEELEEEQEDEIPVDIDLGGQEAEAKASAPRADGEPAAASGTADDAAAPSADAAPAQAASGDANPALRVQFGAPNSPPPVPAGAHRPATPPPLPAVARPAPPGEESAPSEGASGDTERIETVLPETLEAEPAAGEVPAESASDGEASEASSSEQAGEGVEAAQEELGETKPVSAGEEAAPESPESPAPAATSDGATSVTAEPAEAGRITPETAPGDPATASAEEATQETVAPEADGAQGPTPAVAGAPSGDQATSTAQAPPAAAPGEGTATRDAQSAMGATTVVASGTIGQGAPAKADAQSAMGATTVVASGMIGEGTPAKADAQGAMGATIIVESGVIVEGEEAEEAEEVEEADLEDMDFQEEPEPAAGSGASPAGAEGAAEGSGEAPFDPDRTPPPIPLDAATPLGPKPVRPPPPSPPAPPGPAQAAVQGEIGGSARAAETAPPAIPVDARAAVRPPEIPQAAKAEHHPPPPPSPPDPARGKKAKKFRKAWYEEFFDDDFLRTLPFMTRSACMKEAAFITSRLELNPGDRVLDIGCGYGRHAVELAASKIKVTGIDTSLPLMIKAAELTRDEGVEVDYLHLDMREITFDAEFDGAFCMMTSFGYFEDDDNEDVITRVHRALKPGKKFLLEVINRDFVLGDLPSRVWWEGDECVVMDEVEFNFYSSRIISKRSVAFADGHTVNHDLSIRAYSLHELDRVLRRAGFTVSSVTGSLSTEDRFYGPYSPYLIILATKTE